MVYGLFSFGHVSKNDENGHKWTRKMDTLKDGRKRVNDQLTGCIVVHGMKICLHDNGRFMPGDRLYLCVGQLENVVAVRNKKVSQVV